MWCVFVIIRNCSKVVSVKQEFLMKSYCFLQVAGWKIISIGMISSLPASISNIKMNLEKTENSEKFPAGPTISSPGPILFSVAAIAVKFVVKPKPFKLSNKSDPTKTST